MFYNQAKDVSYVVNVEDVFAVGNEEELDRFINKLKMDYNLKKKIIGPDKHQEKSAVYRGRRISTTQQWRVVVGILHDSIPVSFKRVTAYFSSGRPY